MGQKKGKSTQLRQWGREEYLSEAEERGSTFLGQREENSARTEGREEHFSGTKGREHSFGREGMEEHSFGMEGEGALR